MAIRDDATTLLDRSLQSAEVTVPSLRAALDRNSGRYGMAEARRIVEVVESDTESEAERRFADLMRVEGISGWAMQVPIGRYRADFTWLAEKLVVEVDGWAFHKDAVRFQSDHDKRNAFTRQDWRYWPSPGTTWSTRPSRSWNPWSRSSATVAARRHDLRTPTATVA